MSDNPLDPIVATAGEDIIGRVLAVAPDTVTDSALDALISKLRQDRALFIKAELNKGEKPNVDGEAIPVPDDSTA